MKKKNVSCVFSYVCVHVCYIYIMLMLCVVCTADVGECHAHKLKLADELKYFLIHMT